MIAPLLSLALSAAPKLAVLPLAHGEGVAETTAAALTESLAAEVRRQSGADVITRREIESVLSLERQRQVLGCQTDACVAELGGALGVEGLVTGDVARLGESWLVHLKVVRPARAQVTAQADRRIRGGTVDDVLDQLPGMVKELFPAGAALRPAPTAPPPAPAPPPAAAKPPALRAEEPADPGARETLAVFTDGNGHFVVVLPFSVEGPLFAGGAGALVRARLVGGSRDGQSSFGHVFWDPRFPRGAERSFDFRDGKATLTCGGKQVALRPLSAKDGKLLLRKVRFLEPTWRRYPHALARDGEGAYYLLDGARGADGDAIPGAGWAMWLGRKGAMAPVAVEEVSADGGGLLAITSAGRLEVGRDERGRRAEWRSGAAKVPLTWLEPSDHGPLLYRELSPYAGQPLGTPCDPHAG